ncbi:hypothetical protein DUT90_09260 [Polaribacter sp. WD7]|uniref:hypothetical protein n=1 Tax=Polaribacter sp. WD7 TaxID=2269061 RepID=UPI000DF31719|nr:hypothetical protein [Polaribacter sp. WD7]RCS25959.1 hypothetical protein DUT90_09260 [Polaribacter sp. WD7]
MKKLILLVLGFGVIISCYEKENINCLTFEIERPQLFIKIINNEGVNLIENGTINSTNITIEENSSNISFTFIPEGQFGDFNEFDNSIALTVPNESDFRYTVAINDFETIVLDFTLVLTNALCNVSFFQPESVNFNDKELQLMEFPPRQYLIVVAL